MTDTKIPSILFLDIDGVLATHRTCFALGMGHYYYLDPIGIRMIDRLCEQHDLQIVISSCWRGDESTPKVLRACGMKTRLHQDWRTPVLNQHRGNEIRAWLEAHPEHRKWIILDDEGGDIDGDLPRRLIQTDMENGILWANYQQAEKLLQEMGAGL